MTVTLVLRLLRAPLERDELVGHAEVVATGAAHPIRRLEDVLAVARAAAADDERPTSEGEAPAADSRPEAAGG